MRRGDSDYRYTELKNIATCQEAKLGYKNH